MNTKCFIKEVSKNMDIPYKEVEVVMNGIIHTLLEQLKRNQKVSFGELGSFAIKRYSEKVGYDPIKREKKNIDAVNKIQFKTSSKVKQIINDADK